MLNPKLSCDRLVLVLRLWSSSFSLSRLTMQSMKSHLWLAVLVHGLLLQQVAAMFSKRGRDEKQEQEMLQRG
jgi:hypothetical protein